MCEQKEKVSSIGYICGIKFKSFVMNRIALGMLLWCMAILPIWSQESYLVQSPDCGLKVKVGMGEQVSFDVLRNDSVLLNSKVSLSLHGGEVLGVNPKVLKVTKRSVDKEIVSPFYKRSVVKNSYNEMDISFHGRYSLVFRVYNDGVAYRFKTRREGELIISEEEARFQFPSNRQTFAAYVNSTKPTIEEQFFNSFEQPYVQDSIMSLNNNRLKILPLLVDLGEGSKLCITEADLEDYPGMFLNNKIDTPELEAVHAPYPRVKEQGGHNNLQMLVKERENYIAKTQGNRSYPWRVFVISKNDRELADCDMVYRLASPSRVVDTSWIKPGKVAWDWWNDWNIYGVDFRAGINTPTYKYYIDFAADYGIEYVILDEGWAVNGEADLMQVVSDIDLEELVRYADSKHVGIILWAGYWAFARDLEHVVRHYAEMGVKGFKVDFLDRDDQEMVNFVYRAAETCARYKMLLDFHGMFKPTGLQRTYPNVLNYEGVNGLEQLKWSPESYDMVTYDVTIPFIRMVAGPMDYTQGAMRNAARENYHPVNSEPMSQGTRCRQLATYVIFESPFNMLCDSPSNYMREEECTDFIAHVPTVWDETISLLGKVSEYVAIARRHGEEWYVGALTNWEPRELELDLSFLGEDNYVLEYFKDGPNADRAARDYKKAQMNVPSDRKIKVHLAPGGGFVAHIYKIK